MKRMASLVAVIVMAGSVAWAATETFDQAEWYTAWTNGSAGLMAGFGPWQLFTTSTNVSENGHFIGSSTLNGPGTNAVPDQDIDTTGKAWGLYANNGQTAAAVRSLTGGPLLVGQQIECLMDTGYADFDVSAVGIGFLNAQGETVLEILFRGGKPNYEVNDADGLREVTLPYTTDGISVGFRPLSYATYRVSIMSLNPSASTVFAGTLKNPPGGPLVTQLRVFAFNTGSGSDHDQFFNVLAVQDAPGDVAPLPRPTITGVAVTGGAQVVTWAATNAAWYSVETATDLAAGVWSTLPQASNVVTFGGDLSVTNAGGSPTFYRVRQDQGL